MFDYEAFANEMYKQSLELIPPEFSDKEKEYISTTISDFVKLAGESLNNDKENNFSDEQKVFITQVIAEWTFHKSVDLIRAEIPDIYCNAVMQKIAFTIFEVAKQGVNNSIPDQELLEAIEHHVQKVYKECIEEMYNKNVISEVIKEFAFRQSNIDKIAKEASFTTPEITETEEKNGSNDLKIWLKWTNNDYFGYTISCLFILILIIIFRVYHIPTSNYFILSYVMYNDKFLIAFLSVLISINLIGYLSNKNKMKETSFPKIDKILANLFVFLLGIFIVVLTLFLIFPILKIILMSCLLIGSHIIHSILSIGSSVIHFISSTIGVKMFLIILAIACICTIIILKLAVNAEVKYQLGELEKVRQKMNDLVNPDKFYERLGVDVVSLQIGQGLLCIADPDQEGQLLAKTAALRQRLTDNLGYIIPNVRIMDSSSSLKENEYVISIRQNVVDEGFVYTNKYMVILDQWNKTGKPIPESAIKGVDPTYKTEVIWINKIDAIETKEVNAVAPDDVIIQHLQEVLIQQVDKVLSEKDIRKCIDLVNEDNFVSVDELLERLSYGDIRRVFVNLIQEKVSIKDICLVLSRLEDYSRFNREPDILSERLRKDLSRQICLVNCNRDKKIFALGFSSELLENLTNKVEKQTGFNKTQLKLDFDETKNLVETTANTLMKAHQKIGQQPIILVNDELRLPLYRLLVKHIPTIVVLSTSEIEQDIKLEIVDTIK